MEQADYGKRRYQQMVKEASPPSKTLSHCVRAFIFGGAICTAGQLLLDFLLSRGVGVDEARLAVSVTLIFISALLTGLGWYDKIAEHAGAGTLVPITGFANSIAAPAIEFKKEGLVLGVAAKMFVIAGPVIVYGTIASIVVGIVYYFLK
jgi:stage V sporulation protein AC